MCIRDRIWGVACVAIVKVIHPLIYTALSFIPVTLGIVIAVILAAVLFADLYVTASVSYTHLCLFGLKLMRLLAAVVGFVLGAASGVAAAVVMGLTGTTFLIAVLAGAVIIGLLSIFLRRIGIFLLVLCYGFGVCAAVIHPSSMIMYIICLGIAVVLAVLSVLYIEPIVVVVTGISGGLCAGMAAASLIGMEKNILVGYGISIVLAVAGIIVQFMMHSRKLGKKEEVYSLSLIHLCYGERNI